MQNLLKKPFEVNNNWKISVDIICPYKILNFFFRNTGPKDNDCMAVDDSKLVQQYIDESPHNIFKDYMSCLKNLFSEYIMKLPLPTTCFWIQTNESSDGWKHIQNFILLDFGLNYDLPSSVFTYDIDQIRATFYGSMHSNENRLVYNFILLFFVHILLFYQISTYIPICIPEFSVLVILVTFTYHLYTRTVIYQPHTKIFIIYQLYTKL